MKVNFLFKLLLRPLKFFLFSYIFISLNTYASDGITYGVVEEGDTRLELYASDFIIDTSFNNNFDSSGMDKLLNVEIVRGSIEWVRIEEVLLTPRARLSYKFKGLAKDYQLKYRDRVIILHQNKKYAHSEFFISLFHNDTVDIYHNGIKVGAIHIRAKPIKDKRKTHLVDFSCSKYNIKTSGLEDQLVSIGCRSHRIGEFGKEKTMVEVLWSTPNFRTADMSAPPYIGVFMKSDPLVVELVDQDKKEKLKISAKIPKRLHRLNIAYGFGPYVFETTFNNAKTDNGLVTLDQPIAPAFMMYFNFNIKEGESIRGFNAIVAKDSIFNNAGAYYASDIASILDNKLTFTTLLGVQHLYFKFDDKSPIIDEPIFPQGLEINYRHAFGIENYLIGGGAFISPSESYDYQNIWVRWGKGIFWELNYIFWGNDDFSAKMWGLSAGFFFGGFL